MATELNKLPLKAGKQRTTLNTYSRAEELKSDLEVNLLFVEGSLILYLDTKMRTVFIEYPCRKGLSYIGISLLSNNKFLYELGVNKEVKARFEHQKGIVDIGKTSRCSLYLELSQAIKEGELIPVGIGEEDKDIKFLLESIHEAVNSTNSRRAITSKILDWSKAVNVKPSVVLSDEEKEECTKILKKPDLLTYMKIGMEEKDVNESLLGEDHSSLTLFLNCVGALNGMETLNTLKGSSSVGKTSVANMVTGLFNTKKVGDLSPTALKYSESYDYDILYLQESLENDFEQKSFRLLSSDDGGFVALTTIKDKDTNEFKPVEETVPAKTFVTTSTAVNIFDEFGTRAYIIPLDESTEQTKRIVEHNFSESRRFLDKITKKKDFGAKYESIRKALTLLVPFDVIIPYEEDLKDILPSSQLRSRRDSKKLVQLIKCSAFLFQHQRPKTSIEGHDILVATIQDLYNILRIAGPILQSTLTGMDSRTMEAMRIIPDIIREKGYVTNKELTKNNVGSNYASQIHKQLRDSGFLIEDPKLKEKYGITGRLIVSRLNPEHTECLISAIKDLDWLKFKSKEEEEVKELIENSGNYKGKEEFYDPIDRKSVSIGDLVTVNSSQAEKSKEEIESLSLRALNGDEDANDVLGSLILYRKPKNKGTVPRGVDDKRLLKATYEILASEEKQGLYPSIFKSKLSSLLCIDEDMVLSRFEELLIKKGWITQVKAGDPIRPSEKLLGKFQKPN